MGSPIKGLVKKKRYPPITKNHSFFRIVSQRFKSLLRARYFVIKGSNLRLTFVKHPTSLILFEGHREPGEQRDALKIVS